MMQRVQSINGERIYEIDAGGIQQKINDLEKKGMVSKEERVEYVVLRCFRNIDYCMKKCPEFNARDAFAQKSCKDCLDRYVHELGEVEVVE